MRSILIPIHSVVDVITNSSSEIFTWANENAADVAIDLINNMMQVMKVPGTATDYFNFEIVVDPDWIENMRDVAEDMVKYNDTNATTEEIEDHLASGGWENEYLLESDGPRPKGTHLYVTAKDGTPVNVENAFFRMFESVECST
jgi:hypothetical protein